MMKFGNIKKQGEVPIPESPKEAAEIVVKSKLSIAMKMYELAASTQAVLQRIAVSVLTVSSILIL